MVGEGVCFICEKEIKGRSYSAKIGYGGGVEEEREICENCKEEMENYDPEKRKI